MSEPTFEELPQAVYELSKQLDRIEYLLRNQSDIKAEDGKLLTVEEAANFLNIKKSTMYAKVSKRDIPHSKQGKRLYFLKTDLIEWVKKGRVKTQEEIEQNVNTYLASPKRHKASRF